MIGSRLGPYEITAALGAGGMGEVYRATDTRLGREVAIKVLPKAFAVEPERVARFEREAKLLASLNHPNIAHVYGFEKATLDDGGLVHFLAMELVPGEDLAERMARGAIAVEEAIPIAKQIAEALEEAHGKGIVHRDLKPANVKLTPDGKVKVLDFGLAKAWEGEDGGSSPDLSHSPTMTRGTQAGLILGTAAYMSPEQARGKPVDKRADIWAFGVVLYEMLAGRRLFEGETASDTLAAVLRQEIDWSALPAGASAALRLLLRKCLDRDPRRRLHDIADARISIEDALAGGDGSAGEVPRGARRAAASWLAIAVAALAGLGLGAVFARRFSGPAVTATTGAPVRFEIPLAVGSRFLGGVALSPDGRRLVFSAGGADGDRILWLRPLDALEAEPIAGTADARFPFWSPDGRQLGFFAAGELRTMDLVSRAVRTVAKTGPYSDVRGAAWGAGDTIVFAPSYTGGLMRVSAKGGDMEPATRLDLERGQGTHRLPRFLPDGRRFLFYAAAGTGGEPGQICTAQLGALDHRCLTESNSAVSVLPPDALLFVRGSALLAQRLDLQKVELVGEPVALGVDMAANLGSSGHRALTTSAGTIAYHVGSSSMNRLAWVDRDGTERETVYDKDHWILGPRLAPDGNRVVFSVYRPGVQGELWLVERGRRSEIRLAEGGMQSALWSRTGRDLALVTQASSGTALFRMEVQRPDTLKLWKPIPGLVQVDSWLPGDTGVLLTAAAAETRLDIWRLDTTPGAEPQPLLVTPAAEHSPELSPDGNWLAYVSDVTGREEIYVQRFGSGGSPWKVSAAGGNDPRWRADGRELFYVAPGGRLHVVATTTGETFEAGKPQLLFTVRMDESAYRQYDVTADGRRFVVNLSKGTVDSPIVVVLGFAEEIRRRLAAAGGAP